MTDVFATLGPACASSAVLKDMLAAGMTGLRLNLNHGRLSETMPLLLEVREAARLFNSKLQILLDLQGRSLRIGTLPAPVLLREGETILLGKGGIPVPAYLFDRNIEPSGFSLSDGRIKLETVQKRSDTYLCRVVTGGILESRKGMTVAGQKTALPALTETDKESLSLALEAGVTAVMIPFVSDTEQITSVRKALSDLGCESIKIWAKLENKEGLSGLKEWLPEADICVIARGDLGNSFPMEQIPPLQKYIASACRAGGKPFVIATGLLRSLMYETQPSRADISDIFNAVLDGAEGLMLTDETALGARPAASIRYLSNTVRMAEQYKGSPDFYKKTDSFI